MNLRDPLYAAAFAVSFNFMAADGEFSLSSRISYSDFSDAVVVLSDDACL